MRGFQPQHYADGGLVQRAMSLIGGRKKQIDEAVKVASQDTRQASAPAPEPVKTTPDGKFDEKRASKDNPAGIGFADGGRVRPRGFVAGPGTGTSDSIPAQLSNGEYVLPADTVRAVGVDKLDALLEETHEPVRGFAPKAAPEEPRQFFGNGGAVKRLHLADAGEVTRKRLEEEGRVPGGAPSPTNIFPGNRLPGDSGSTSAAPAAPAAPAPSVPSKPAGLPADTLPQEQGDPFLSTPKARAGLTQGQQPATTPSAPSAPVTPAPTAAEASGAGLNAPWWSREYATAARLSDKSGLELDQMRRANAVAGDPVKSIVMSGTLGPGSTPSSQQQQTSTTPATATLNSVLESQRRSDAINGSGANAKANTNDSSAPPATEPEPKGREVLPGAYTHGRGQYSDNAQGMGFAPGFTGKPSEQNMAAADALDMRSQADSMARLQARGFSPGGGAQAQATYDPNAGTSSQWTTDLRDPRNLALRNASVGSTIFRTKEEAMAANKAKMANVAGVRGAIAGQMHDAQQADTTRYQSDNALAGTHEQANAQRYATDAQAAASRQRNAIDTSLLALESQVKGFDIQQAKRRESILGNYDKGTAEQKAALREMYPDIFGSTNERGRKMQVVPGKPDPITGEMMPPSAFLVDEPNGTVTQVPIQQFGKTQKPDEKKR